MIGDTRVSGLAFSTPNERRVVFQNNNIVFGRGKHISRKRFPVVVPTRATYGYDVFHVLFDKF